MRDLLLKPYVKIRVLKEAVMAEDGAALLETVLVMALIALGVTAAMNDLAGRIAGALVSIHDTLVTYSGGGVGIKGT